MSVNSTGGKKENGSKTMIWRQRLLKMKGKMMFRVLIFITQTVLHVQGMFLSRVLWWK